MSQVQHHYTESDFKIVRVVGKGSIGKVMLVQEKASALYFALKSIKKSDLPTDRQRKAARQEKDIFTEKLLKTDSPFLGRLHATFQTETHLFYLFEYYPGGDFATLLSQHGKLPEANVQLYAAELVLGLEALRDLGIVYRDLKPENIVMDRNGHLVMVDFGLSKVLEAQTACHFTKTFCGTAEYLAPEVLLGKPYGFAVDLWSLGTMIYEMLVGVPPYWAEAPQEMYKKIIGAQAIEFPGLVSEAASDLIRRMLKFNPNERLGFGSMSDIKHHAFFSSIDWGALQRKEIPAPHQPTLMSDEDVSGFDQSFTGMAPMLTPVDYCGTTTASVRHHFTGFTFNPA